MIRVGSKVLYRGIVGRVEGRQYAGVGFYADAACYRVMLVSGVRVWLPAGDLAFEGEDERIAAIESMRAGAALSEAATPHRGFSVVGPEGL